jgi:hypothetical protein
MTGRNPWAVLRVAEGAPYDEIQRAFRRRVKQAHPDAGGDAREFASVMQAYDVVRNAAPSQRIDNSSPYDSWLRPAGTPQWWNDDGDLVPVASGFWTEGSLRPQEMLERSDFSSVLRHEMAKGRVEAILV